MEPDVFEASRQLRVRLEGHIYLGKFTLRKCPSLYRQDIAAEVETNNK